MEKLLNDTSSDRDIEVNNTENNCKLKYLNFPFKC